MVLTQILLVVYTSYSFAAAPTKPIKVQVSYQNDTVHLELQGRESWNYDLKRADQGRKSQVQMEIDSLSSESITVLKSFKSQLVKSIQVTPNYTQGKDLVTFELVNGAVEHFDYLTDEPSRLIVDFYMSPEEQAKTKKQVDTSTKEKKNKDSSQPSRQVASEVLRINEDGPLNIDSAVAKYGLFDGADPNFERFTVKDYEIKEESIIKNKDRFYIPFPWLFRSPKKWSEVVESGSVYHVHPQMNEENKQMRLLEKLFERNRNNVFLQTKDWFVAKYPQSQYLELVDFMTADVYWRMYEESKDPARFDKALQSYKQALDNHPKSPMSEKTSLLIPIRLFNRGDYLASLRSFNQHVENKQINFSSSLSKELAQLGVALSYMHLKRYQEATELLKKIETTSTYNEVKHEAAYRLGDIEVLSGQFADAIESYNRAQKKYPVSQNDFPSSFFNKSEAEFRLGNYRRSLDDFREYIKRFPSDAQAPLALTRIGENMEILGADKSRSMGAYLEAYFRFGETPNAIIARIRMTAARMKTMKPKEAEIATQQILELSRKVDLKDADKLATILIAEGFGERGDFSRATQLLIDFYQKNPTMSDKDQFTKRIIANINESIRELVENGDFMKALETHQKYADNRLKNSNRLDTRFFIGRSFEMAGVPKESEKYYREILNRLQSVEGTPSEKEIRVVEHLPSKERLFLRLAQAQAKQNKLQEAYESLRQIKNSESLSEDEQVERVILSADLLTEKEQFESAKRFVMELLRTWRGEPDKMVQPYMKLAEIENRMGQSSQAIESLRKVDELMTDAKKEKTDVVFKSLEKRIEIAESTKNQNELVASTERMLELFEETKPIASIRYKLGEIFFKQGRIKRAEKTWTGFKGAQADFWGNLAQEQLKNVAWRDDYKKYIERIPAMSQEEQK